ncbi:hypothetical protein BD770DRAFT_215562 [Pilaira anomala]|nr:hypothetical protein BD770DRAFT_215562 [Pilaira anomala]
MVVVLIFILAGPRQQQAALPDLDLSDFTGEEINQRFHLWDVDPGLKTIFTASDGYGEDPHQVRKYSTDEYYTRAGFKKTSRKFLAERDILTDKTDNIETFTLYVHSVLNNLGNILSCYDNRFTALRFLNYIGRYNELMQKLLICL